MRTFLRFEHVYLYIERNCIGGTGLKYDTNCTGSLSRANCLIGDIDITVMITRHFRNYISSNEREIKVCNFHIIYEIRFSKTQK